jgi:hypothetical protein
MTDDRQEPELMPLAIRPLPSAIRETSVRSLTQSTRALLTLRRCPGRALLLAWAVLTLVAPALAADPPEKRVERWEPVDLPFQSKPAPENPFLVPFSAEVRGPGGITLEMPGFFDGDATWVIRVSPTAPGEWSVRTRSPVADLDGQSNRFVCVPSSGKQAHGPLRVDRDHPYHFVYDDGARFFPLGYECDWLWALGLDKGDRKPLDAFLDKLETAGFNYVILNAYAHDTSWRKGKTGVDDYGPPPLFAWEGSNAQPDHSRFNLAYWHHYDSVIDALARRGMVAHLMIKVYNKMVNWPRKGGPEDDLFFRWLVARYAAYTNVHWDFSKEANNEKDLAYKRGRIEFLRRTDPYHRLITVHDDKKTYDEGSYDDLLDYRSDQQHTNWHASLLDHRRRHAWPLLNVEFGYEHGPKGPEDVTYRVEQPAEEVCRRAWNVVMAGGYGVYYYTYTAWDVLRPGDTPPGYADSSRRRRTGGSCRPTTW